MNSSLPRRPTDRLLQDRYRGCLLGGAVGDALGAPVEFMSDVEIAERFGTSGIKEYVPSYGRLGAITDDTQMTLFTAEGLLRAYVRGALRGICYPPGVLAYAYLRWLHTQGERNPFHEHHLSGWLIGHPELFAQRAPGLTCLAALRALRKSNDTAHNDSKGCGGVMRVAPVGMLFASLTRDAPRAQAAFLNEAFDLACQAAAITHGHRTGQLASGAFAVIVMQLLLGAQLPVAIEGALPLLTAKEGHEETTAAIHEACRLAAEHPNDVASLKQLGGGWVAEEALAMALYCALSAPDFRSGVVLAVNHGGDSDSTGSMAGQLLGAMLGEHAIPASWLEPLELQTVLEDMADDLATVTEWRLNEDDGQEEEHFYFKRYPGG